MPTERVDFDPVIPFKSIPRRFDDYGAEIVVDDDCCDRQHEVIEAYKSKSNYTMIQALMKIIED